MHCLRRLINILNAGFYLEGSGDVEKYLYNEINGMGYPFTDELRKSDDLLYFQMAKQILSDSFNDFYFMIACNLSSSESSTAVDDFVSKCEAWRVGLFVNNIFLNSNLSISY